MQQKNKSLFMPIIFVAVTNYVIYDMLNNFWLTIVQLGFLDEFYNFNVMMFITSIFAMGISIVMVNKLVIRKEQKPILTLGVSIVAGIIIIFLVMQVERIHIEVDAIRMIIWDFWSPVSVSRNILLSALASCGESIVLRFLRITPEEL